MLAKRIALNEENKQSDRETVQQMAQEFKQVGVMNYGEGDEQILNCVEPCIWSRVAVNNALERGECMCLGVNVKLFAAGVADSSRTVVRDVSSYFMTASQFVKQGWPDRDRFNE